MNAALRRRLAVSALGGLIALAAAPAAMAQWLPPWRVVASPADIAGMLGAQGYVLVAPLQRRPGVYLADVRAGPGGSQRLVIDDRNGQILERFISLPRRFGPQYAVRFDEFGEPPPPSVGQLPPGPGIRVAPNGGPVAKSTVDGPTNVHIPSVVSPFGSQLAPLSPKPKSKSAPIARRIAPATAPPVGTPPLPPPAPREAARPDASAPAAPNPEPQIDSPPGETENASTTPATPEAKPEVPGAAPQAEAQVQPTTTTQSLAQPLEPAVAPASEPATGGKAKVNVVPPALFE